MLVPIHDGYVGGDHYFGQHDESEPEFYLWHKVLQTELDALKKEDRRRVRADQILNTEKIAALRHALITFVTAASIRRIQQQKEGETPKRYAMVVHVETSRKSHDWQHTVVGEVLDAMKDAAGKNDPIFIALINEALSDLAPSMEAENLSIPPEKEIVLAVRRAFQRGGVVTETVNSDKDVETLLDENAELRLRTPYNVFIGGQILDRGITVPNLIGFYYGRSPKRMQQDTVLQHARMYGNRPRKDLAVTRFYTSAHNYLALAAIHDFDAALRFAFETGAHDRGVAFVHRDTSKSIIPCAPSKILLSEIVSLRPGGAHVPFGFQTISKTKMEPILSKIDQLTSKASEGGPGPIRASSDLAVQIIELIEGTLQFETGYDFDWDACKAAIEYFSKIASPEAEQGNCWLLVRTGRTIKRIRKEGRYSDAPHTYQDRTAIKKIDGFLPVLALFRQEGRNEDDWKGTPFWWPVLFAPKNASPAVFAASISED
ncbi:MAG: hypothetical protein HQ495_06735 [Alphaproteobacteria bacterium]|nr:hypothetical protein [Alphaproteobacteria bacterium]